MTNSINLSSKDLKKIIAMFFNIDYSDIIANTYSYTVLLRGVEKEKEAKTKWEDVIKKFPDMPTK